MKLYNDPCEYNPTEGRAAYENEVHANADFIVGANGKWRLCAACASLPEFKRLKKKPVNNSLPKLAPGECRPVKGEGEKGDEYSRR
jgi:hypothetical protein